MVQGLVIKSTGSWYKVRIENGDIVDCKIKGKFRIDNLKSTNPIAVGDIVSFQMNPDGIGSISEIHDRKNYIIRKSSNLSKQSHIIAANIDCAYLVVTLKFPETYLLFIDRFLVTCEAYNIPVTIVVNKTDLYQEKEMKLLEEWRTIYTKSGYNFIAVSATTNQNVDYLRELMTGKINLFSGNSGVGKSTLVNCIEPGLLLKTDIVSSHNKKGQHTTTFAEMFELSNGGYIIDTPGLKAFGLLEMEKWEISHYFPEMFGLLDECQYHNCTHVHEPGCKVIQALESGEISNSRYQNYLSLMTDEESSKYRRGY